SLDPSRGGATKRRLRKLWLLHEFGLDGVAMCAFGCGAMLVFGDPEGVVEDDSGTFAPITVDRHPVPGCDGGTYEPGNIRPACGSCNSRFGGAIRRKR